MFKLVNKTKYELMKKMIECQDNYIEQIKMKTIEVNGLKYDNKLLRDSIFDSNIKIKSLIGKIGGLTASNNHKIRDNEFLKEKIINLETEVAETKRQLEFYKKYGKTNEKLEKPKNYKEIRKECEKRERGCK